MELDEKVYRLISVTRKEMTELKNELNKLRSIITHNMKSDYTCPVCNNNKNNPYRVVRTKRAENNEYMQRYVRCKKCDSSILQIITNLEVLKEGDKHVNRIDNI